MGGAGELGVDFLLVQLFEGFTKFGQGEQLISAGHLLDAEASLAGFVLFVQLGDGFADLLGRFQLHQLCESARGEGVMCAEKQGFEHGQIDRRKLAGFAFVQFGLGGIDALSKGGLPAARSMD